MTDDIEDRADATLEGVTPGPWEMLDGFIYPLSINARIGGIRPADAQFIAAARQLVPELVAKIKRIRTRLVPRTVTRVVLVHADSKYAEKWAESWDVYVQDDGRTLKLFPQQPTVARYMPQQVMVDLPERQPDGWSVDSDDDGFRVVPVHLVDQRIGEGLTGSRIVWGSLELNLAPDIAHRLAVALLASQSDGQTGR